MLHVTSIANADSSYMPFVHAGEGQAGDGALAVTAQARQPQCCSRVPECQYMQVPSRDVLRTREVRALSCHERQ